MLRSLVTSFGPVRRRPVERADEPVFLALGHTIARHDLPLEPLRDLLRAFRRDAAGDTAAFATFADVLDYCRCSADPVGRIVLALFGYRDPERQTRADDICTALQLTNGRAGGIERTGAPGLTGEQRRTAE